MIIAYWLFLAALGVLQVMGTIAISFWAWIALLALPFALVALFLLFQLLLLGMFSR
jgi:hypothetical protein